MLLFTITFGGLLLMMGHHSRAESLFDYFRLEDQVPENHLLRLIDRQVNFEFIRSKLKDSYSDTGRPSIDPELLLRMLLVGYLYGVTSERGRAGHASGVAMVHRTGVRSGDSASLHVFQESTWTIPGIESVSGDL
jgi:hypothetical protein